MEIALELGFSHPNKIDLTLSELQDWLDYFGRRGTKRHQASLDSANIADAVYTSMLPKYAEQKPPLTDLIPGFKNK